MPTGIADGYDRNADRYDAVTRHNREAARRLVASLPGGPYRSLLDVGCGTGYATIAMLERFAPSRVVAVDVSAEMIERMRDKLGAHSGIDADLLVGDIEAMPTAGERFDCVLASMALHWFARRGPAMTAMAGHVAPGGVIGLVAPGPGHDFEYTEVLRGVRPAVPPEVIEIFRTAQVFPDEVEGLLAAAGIEPLDVWVERRVRHVPPAEYMGRITAVGSHVWRALMDEEEAAAMIARITRAVERAAGPRGFTYTFTKTYAVGRRPAATP